MTQYKVIECPYCACTDLVKNGRCSSGTQRYVCKACKKCFRLDYVNRACEPGMKDKIDNQILNSSGVRDTARVLGINSDLIVGLFASQKINKFMIMLLECILKNTTMKRRDLLPKFKGKIINYSF
ncbi:UNVERIFIED_CONTAM: hypothetical protein GTU68_028933 [Idotea baltica]|nr:hypothetical protein [Idotea baltica]